LCRSPQKPSLTSQSRPTLSGQRDRSQTMPTLRPRKRHPGAPAPASGSAPPPPPPPSASSATKAAAAPLSTPDLRKRATRSTTAKNEKRPVVAAATNMNPSASSSADEGRPFLDDDGVASAPGLGVETPSPSPVPDTRSWAQRNQWIVFALASGACAAFNGVFAKL
jgi:hypothetical protein